MRGVHFALVALVLGGCGIVRGSGVPAEEERALGPFDSVATTNMVRVEAEEGSEQSVTVSCDDNLLDLVLTDVFGSELRVYEPMNTVLIPRADCVVRLVAPRLESLSTTGSGGIDANGDWAELRELRTTGSGGIDARGALSGLEVAATTGSGGITVHGLAGAGHVSLETTGSGGIEASGDANAAELRSTGSGGIHAADLTVEHADITLTGSGGAWLTVTGDADVTLTGSGSAHLYGDPSVDAKQSGSGRVIVE